MSLWDYLHEKSRGLDLKSRSSLTKSATPVTSATNTDNTLETQKYSSKSKLQTVASQMFQRFEPPPFKDLSGLKEWTSCMGRRLKRIERSRGRSGVFFEPDEFEVFRECIRQSYYYEQTRIDTEDPTAYAKTHITVPTERTAEYQALYSEAFILLEYYTSSFDSLLRIFPISINNLDIYSAFRSYHRQHVLPAKNQENRKPEEWSEKRCKRTNVIVLERGLVERAKSPPEDWILPYLTLPINELDKLLDACKEKTESSKGESLAA